MKIIQISDLHINDKTPVYSIFKGIERMYREILKNDMGDNYTILVCGDVTDGESEDKEKAYLNAKMVFNKISETFKEHDLDIAFVPGNHDIDKPIESHEVSYDFDEIKKSEASLKKFDVFASEISAEQYTYDDINVVTKVYDEINFIFASSVIHKNRLFGMIDIEEVERHCREKNVIVSHHYFISIDKTDRSQIVNAEGLFRIIEGYDIRYFMHGHTHKDIVVRKLENCMCIGVQSISDNYFWPPFNLISIENGEFINIFGYRYNKVSKDYFPYDMLADKNQTRYSIDVSNNSITQIEDTLNKVVYPVVENYIKRSITPSMFWNEGHSTEGKYFSNDVLHSALDECKRIVLLSEAGGGKTVELRNLAYILYSENDKYPILFNLKYYKNNNIEEIVGDDYKDLEGRLYLLFDGYDEMDSNYKKEFIIKIYNYCKKHSETKVVITSRFNFYQEKIDGFYEYRLNRLSNDTQIKFIREEIKNFREFDDEVEENGLEDLLEVPFFLKAIVTVYNQKKELSSRSDVLETIIRFSIDCDIVKYTHENKKDPNFIYDLLQRLGFSMQLIAKHNLSEDEYHQLLNLEERNSLNSSSIWTKHNGKWGFEHNNFKEYLAARYMKEMQINDIEKLIMISNDEVHYEWINVVSFLVAFDEQEELKNMLIDNAQVSIIKFEKDRISPEERHKIFEKIIKKYKNLNIWIDYYEPIASNLVLFSASKEAVEFLLNEIINPIHFRSLANAIKVLSKFNEIGLFGLDIQVTQSLIDCCTNPDTRDYEISDCIYAFIKLGLATDAVTNKLIELFSKNGTSEKKTSTVRTAMYYYLSNSNNIEKYIDYFLSGIECVYSGKDVAEDGATTMEGYHLKESIKKIDTYNANNKILEEIFNKYNKGHFFYKKDILEIAIENAVSFYEKGNSQQYNSIFEYYKMDHKNAYSESINLLKQFFIKTKTIKQACDDIISIADTTFSETDKILLFEETMDDDIFNEYIEMFIQSGFKEPQIIDSLLERRPYYIKKDEGLREALLKGGRKDLVKDVDKYDNTWERKIKQKQQYFNSLFDNQIFKSLIREVIEKSGNPDLKFNQINDAYFDVISKKYEREDLFQLCVDLQHFFIKKGEEKVADYLIDFNWEPFCIYQIYKVLNSDRIEVEPSDSQEQYIRQYFYDNINKDEKYIIILIFFMIKFEIVCSEKNLLDMLLVSQQYFSFYDNNKLLITDKINYNENPFGYLEISHNKLDEQLIKERVIENVRTEDLKQEVLRSHLMYCKKHKIIEAIELAKNVCIHDNENNYYKCEAVEYLIEVSGLEYIHQEILPKVDDELKLDIARLVASIATPDIVDYFEKYYDSDKSNWRLVEYLIIMNSRVGLDAYYDMIKDKGLEKRKDNSISMKEELARTIESIDEIKHLAWVMKLLDLKYNGHFQDNGFYKLYNSLHNILTNMCYSRDEKKFIIDNYNLVSKALDDQIRHDAKNYELIGFCNNVLKGLESGLRQAKQRPYTIYEVKKIIDKHGL